MTITFQLTIRDAQACPNCGQDCLATTNTVDAKTWAPKGKKVACFVCGALGPIGQDLSEAVIAWNNMDKPAEYLPPPEKEIEL